MTLTITKKYIIHLFLQVDTIEQTNLDQTKNKMSEIEKPALEVSLKEELNEETDKQENSKNPSQRTKRSVVDLPPRTNTGSDGTESDEFK